MPGAIDGFELARQVMARWPHMKVVLTSGFPEAKVNGNLGGLAASARLLSKPYRKEELARLLREVLAGRGGAATRRRKMQSQATGIAAARNFPPAINGRLAAG